LRLLDGLLNGSLAVQTLLFQLPLQSSLLLLVTLKLITSLIEPTLELALRASSESLKLDNSMEEVCACCGEIGNLPG
jgi:hypothetical protein